MLINAASDIGSRVTGAIQQAAQATSAGFDYLLKTALRESGFDPNARATTSSATGLFQFIDQTWLSTVKQSGPQLGYGAYADSIVKTPSGNYVVPNAAARRQVMELRTDPTANAVMAGAFTQRNAARLTSELGRPPSSGELYMAHVLGPGGALKLISATTSSPQVKAASLFPAAARANPSIFYDGQGGARSAIQVHDLLDAKMNGTLASAPAAAAAAPAAISAALGKQVASATAGGAAASSGVAADTVVSSLLCAGQHADLSGPLPHRSDHAGLAGRRAAVGRRSGRRPVDHLGCRRRGVVVRAGTGACGRAARSLPVPPPGNPRDRRCRSGALRNQQEIQ